MNCCKNDFVLTLVFCIKFCFNFSFKYKVYFLPLKEKDELLVTFVLRKNNDFVNKYVITKLWSIYRIGLGLFFNRILKVWFLSVR